MDSIAFLCPYFGKISIPIHTLWLRSCGANPEFDFFLITDDLDALEINCPSNVKGIYMTWEACKERVKSCFDFDVALNSPYKLCDFKPAFGMIFKDLIKDYGFWGHIDSTDTILGALRVFITKEILDSYDKIHSFGHFTIYRNSVDTNLRFRIPPSCGITIQELFSRSEVTGFDEMNHPWSINTIYRENNFSLLERIPNLVADILPSKYAFQIVEDKGERIPRIFEWDNGRLYDVTVHNAELHRREIGYVHFQKRKMTNELQDWAEHFYMIPNRFISADQPLTHELIDEWSKDRLYLDPLKGRIKRIFNYALQPSVFARKIQEKIGKKP